MKATAIVNGRVVTFSLSRGLAAAQRRNSGRTLTAAQAIAFVVRIRDVRVTRNVLRVGLTDGRTIEAPLAWYPTLLHASERQRRAWRACGAGTGIHWPLLDYHLSVAGLMAGRPEAAGISAGQEVLQPA